MSILVTAAHYVHVGAAFAAARAYDRALLTNRRPREQPNHFNFPVQDYVAEEDSDLSKAAMVQLHAFQVKSSSKRPRPSSFLTAHQSPSSKHRRNNTSHAQPRCAVDPPVGHSNAVPFLPVKRSCKRQTVADQHLRDRQAPAAEKPGKGASWHQMHRAIEHAHRQLHKQAKMGSGSWQAETGLTEPVDDADMAQRYGVDSDQHVHDKEPSTSANHHSQSSVVSGASPATSTQRTNRGCPPGAKPAADLDAGTTSAFETDSAQTGAAGSAASDDAARQHKEPQRATLSSQKLLDTALRQDHPSLHAFVCPAHRQARASLPHAVPGSFHFPDAPAHPTQARADGPTASYQAGAALSDKPAGTIPAATPQSDGYNYPSGSNAGQAAAKPSSSVLSPEPETVRAGDSDDDVEIMDDSPVHKPISSDTLRQGTPPNKDGCSQQQAREKALHWESVEGDLPPWHQEQQLPDQQLPGQQDLPTWQQQQQPGKRPQEQQQQQQCFQNCMQQHFFQQEAQSSWQQKEQQQPQHAQAGQSFNPPDLSGMSHLAQQVFTSAGGQSLPPSLAAAGTAVKQEPAASRSCDNAHIPHSGHQSQEVLAGSSLSHPLELSESDADSSASSSVDPTQLVPPPWLRADTAASRRQQAPGHGDCANAQVAVPAGTASAQAANRALLGQASQGSTLTNGHLRTKR